VKVLLADDSMTAQNMGKKILVDAGFDVIAVSNGAQAMKKIAAEKPQILVLDVFMPGYSGLEVCEKVKSSPQSVPVLLTVSKLEPFKPEEANKVKADGLIIKPFEASDLATAVQKLAEKLVPAKPATPAYEDTAKITAPIVSDEEWGSAPAAEEPEPAAQRIEVPQEMAAAAAFDVPGDAAPVADFAVPAFTASEPAPEFAPQAPAAMWDATAASHDASSSFFTTEPTPTDFGLPVASAPASDTAVLENPLAAAEPAFAAAAPAEWEPTAAPAVDVPTPQVGGFEPTIDTSSIDVATAPDPALATGPGAMSEFTTHFGVANAEPIPVGYAVDASGAAAAPAFEAVVEEQPHAALEPEISIEAAPAAAVEEAAPAVDPLLQQMHDAVSAMPVETTPMEEHVEVEHVPTALAAPAPPAPDTQFADELAAAITNAPVAAFEGEAPLAEDDPVARAVDRVLDRFKAELIAEIMRELKR